MSRISGNCSLTPVFVMFLVLPATTQAASFDCTKAATEVEKLICADKELSSLDDNLATSYQKALDTSPDKDALKRTQIGWLKGRDNCKDKACLKDKYKSRVALLNNLSKAALERNDTIRRELIAAMEKVNFVPQESINKAAFCQAFFEDFKTQTHIFHVEPVLQAASMTTPP